MPAFSKDEYDGRLRKVRLRMAEPGIDLLLVTEPANMNYLTGYDGWSFYVPQLVALPLDGGDPLWMGRAMDAAGARLTVWMPDDAVIGYPEAYVQARDCHPMEYIAAYLRDHGWNGKRIGVETDSYYFSPRAYDRLRAGLPGCSFIDADLLVNWVRAVKSAAEIACMRDAARLVGRVMRSAHEAIEPGRRQCDAIAAIYAAQVGGDPDFSGDVTGLCPVILTGRSAAAPHVMWSDQRFEPDQTSAIELAAARHHYHAALARTVHLGEPPPRLLETANAVNEGLDIVLATIRAGVRAADVEAAWRGVISRYGLTKESRIGYAIGLGYPPDWGEHTISLRAGEEKILEQDNTLHVMLGMWMEGWGMELSETVRVTQGGSECLTDFPREVCVKR